MNKVLSLIGSLPKKVLNIIKGIGIGILALLKNIWYLIINIPKNTVILLKNFISYFIKGSIGTKISYVVMGFGNIYHGQIIKGIIYFLIEWGFFSLMIAAPIINGTPIGFVSILNFITLGTYSGDELTLADNSLLMLLFGVIVISLCVLFLVIYWGNIKSSYYSDTLVKKNKINLWFKNDVNRVLDHIFSIKKIESNEDFVSNTINTISKLVETYKASPLLADSPNLSRMIESLEGFGKYLTENKYKLKANLLDSIKEVYDLFIVYQTDVRKRMNSSMMVIDIKKKIEEAMFIYHKIEDTDPKKEKKIRRLSLVLLSDIKECISFGVERLVKTPTTFKQDIKELGNSKFHIALLTPSIIGIFIFNILPTIVMILVAFTNFDSSRPMGQSLFNWVGFANFSELFTSTGEIGRNFFPILLWTLIWAVFATVTCYIMGILLALLINKKEIKGKKIYRTLFILTIAIPQFVSLLVINRLFSVNGPWPIGIFDEGYTGNILWTKIGIVIVNMWIGVPYTMLLTSGILLNVPQDLYEAASIDGATKMQMFTKITLPYVLFITTPYLITAFMGNITSFTVIYFLTGGGPVSEAGMIAGKTDLLVTWLYKLTVDKKDYNIGGVVSIVSFIVMAIGTLFTYSRSKAYKEEEAFQ